MKKAFADTLTKIALADPRVVLVTGDYCYGMFDRLKAERPAQYVNAGTCEQATVGYAAGLAIGGFVPFVYTITPFLLERAFEQYDIKVDGSDLTAAIGRRMCIESAAEESIADAQQEE